MVVMMMMIMVSVFDDSLSLKLLCKLLESYSFEREREGGW
jgi:hypothetical protein